MMTRTDALRMQRGYIPSGKTATKEELKSAQFRKCGEYEVFRCAAAIANDPQSGPIYCGDVADYMAELSGGILAVCERHRRRM